MTPDEVREVVSLAVNDTLERLGIDVENPLAMQKDFAHMRQWRESTDAMKRRGALAVVGLLVSGAAGLIWVLLKQLWAEVRLVP